MRVKKLVTCCGAIEVSHRCGVIKVSIMGASCAILQEHLRLNERVLMQCGMLEVTEPDDIFLEFLGKGTKWCYV